MALLPFKKLTLVCLSDDKDKVLTALSRCGSTEVIATGEIEGTKCGTPNATAEELCTKMAKLSFCFDFWKEQKIKLAKYAKKQTEDNKITTYQKQKTPLIDKLRGGKPEVTFEEMDSVAANEAEVWAVAGRIDAIAAELVDNHGKEARNEALIEGLTAYEKVDAKLNALKDTARTAVFLGTVAEEQLAGLDTAEFEPVVRLDCGVKAGVATVFFAVEKAKGSAFDDYLTSHGFNHCSYDFDCTAAEKIASVKVENENLFRRSVALSEEAVSLEKARKDMEILFDYYRIEREKCGVSNGLRFSKCTFVLTAWVPSHLTKQVQNALATNNVTCYYDFADPQEGEKYPTLCSNNAFVAPYESITNMYSAPSPREIDPNPFVAFFYFLLFGLMVSDAAYGVILTLVGFGLYAIKKPRKGEGSLLLVIGMGGISTVVWGVMFGGYFGESLLPAVMFNPLESPLYMLILSVSVGFFQIMFGMGISAVAKFRQGKALDAVFGEIAWYVLFIGLGGFVASAMVKSLAALKWAGIIMLALGGAGVLVGGALHKKGIKGKLIGAFGNVYGITGFLSDILSYCRLFGLGLATGVVGMVVNLIAGILRDLIPVVGYVLYVVILVVGHVFNIAINTLGAYVHNSRLQYVEFFSRFYTGGGHLFKPFGSGQKYIYLGKNKEEI